MTSARAAAIGVCVLALSGVAQGWSRIGVPVVVGALLLLPGYVLAAVLDDTDARRGTPGRIALAFSLSVAVFSISAMITAFLGLEWNGFVRVLASLQVCLAATAWRAVPQAGARRDDSRGEWLAMLLALVVLLPVVMRFAGGGVDDWWDLAYVRVLADRPAIDFREPMLGSDRVHPRFSWSAWLLLQASVRRWTSADSVELQSQVLAPIICVGSLSAVLLLARAVYGARSRASVIVAVLAVPAWIYATDSLPYFTRLHQDKFVAAFVLMPVLLATALDYIAKPTARRAIMVTLAATALCSVHTLVFGVGVLGVVSCSAIGLLAGRERRGWYAIRSGPFGPRQAYVLAAVLVFTLLPPLWQAWTLRAWFVEQGVGLATPDNPVVRAHLALGRLIAAGTPYMIVHPAAVFGPIGPVVAAGVWLALRRRSVGDAYLLALTLVPAAVLFVPFLAGGVGMLTVPWMLYRIGWLIPQPLLIARVFTAAFAREGVLVRWSVVVVCAVVLLVLTAPTAADRLRRGMREHPFSYEMFPRGTTLAAYRFLDRAQRPGPVLAPVGFSNLVPALTGRSVVALSERGTLVFAGSEANAYARLRDRAAFFACATEAVARKQIADDYGVAYAVFRRRYRTTGDESAWLERATADGVLLATDPSLPISCSATDAQLRRLLPEGWTIVFANSDYFIVETDAEAELRPPGPSESASVRWLDVVGAESDDPRDDGEVLASATGFPGGFVSVDPVPAGLGIGSELLWAAGGALWDDGPVEVTIEIALRGACPVTSVEIIPYLETRRREVLEIGVDDRVHAVHARDGIPRRIALARKNRDSLRLVVRSRLGLPFGIADVRLFGDRAACVGGWRPLARPEIAGRPVPLAPYFALSNRYPRSPRAALDLATRVGEVTSTEDAIATLRRGLSREPGQAAAWIELGLRLDAIGRFDEARSAYRRARAADSNSAWAHGCLAWAELRAGRPVGALWHSWRAERLDPRYADAVTIAALAWERVGAIAWSARALDRAIEMGPGRGWPYYERARQLADDGRREEARALLRRYQARVPDDPVVSERLHALAAGDSVGH